MKKSSLFSLLLLLPFSLFADCTGSGIQIWPQGEMIRRNPVIIVEGYARSQKIILALNQEYPIHLVSGNEKVKLLVFETCKGEYELTQALLRPENTLKAGLEYELVIGNLPDGERVETWDTKTNRHLPCKWKVLDETDLIAPMWDSLPVQSGMHYTMFGCGPAKYVHFSAKAKDNSECLVKVTKTDLASGTAVSYYVPVLNGQIAIGHSMCSGEFSFEDGKEYTVEFLLVDASGNSASGQIPKAKFIAPTPANQED